jgi:hypothetical protein
VGEKLRIQRFILGTRGFASPDDCTMAVCVLPGTELAFADSVTCYGRAGLLGWKPKVFNHTTAIFRQVNKDIAWTHHDALEFPDGKIVLLTHLLEGQEATVLQLPAQPVTSDQTKAQERIPHI